MKKAKQPRWMSDEAWQRHQAYVTTLNARLLAVLHRELAEAQADLEADRADPDLQQLHESRILVLQCQIDDLSSTASYQQEPSRPVVVRADRPPRSKRSRASAKKPQAAIAPPKQGL